VVDFLKDSKNEENSQKEEIGMVLIILGFLTFSLLGYFLANYLSL